MKKNLSDKVKFFLLISASIIFSLVLSNISTSIASAAITYNINFDANGGVGGGVVAIADTTDSIPLAPLVSNSGHTLLGFSTAPNGTPVTVYIVSGQDFTLYAVWSLNSYLISFDTQGGGSNTSVSIPYYTEAITHAPSVSKSNYIFLGWSATPGGQVTSSYAVQASATLYAVYSVIVPLIPTPTYTVAFSNQGHNSTIVDMTNVTTILFANLPSETNSGYFTFSGWSTTPTGSVLTGDYTPTANSTLYAIWVDKTPIPPVITLPVITPPIITLPVITPPIITPPVKYRVTFDINNGTGENSVFFLIAGSDALKSVPIVSLKGHTFSGWSLVLNGPKLNSYIVSDNSVLYAIWSLDSYKINFDSNDGESGVQTFSIAYLEDAISSTPKEIFRNGYSLVGWSDSKYGLSLSNYAVTKETTLYAIWKINTYKVSFNGNVGSWGNVPDTIEYTPAHGSVTLPDPLILIKLNSVFSGWSESRTGGILYSPYIPTGNVTLYAIWTTITKTNTVVIPSGKDTTIALNSSYGTLDSIVSFGLGFDKVILNGSDITYSVPVSSSGLTSIKILIKNNDKQKIIEIPVMILSSRPVNFNISYLNLSSPMVSWYSYDKTSSYSLYVDGKNVCNTTKLSCKINKIIGPSTKAYMITHVEGQSDIKSPVLYQMRTPIPASKVNFIKGSLIFKMAEKNELANLAQMVNSNGFTQVLILGKMSRFQGRAVYDKFTALIPKANILVMDYAPNIISNKDKPSSQDLLATTVTVSIL